MPTARQVHFSGATESLDRSASWQSSSALQATFPAWRFCSEGSVRGPWLSPFADDSLSHALQ